MYLVFENDKPPLNIEMFGEKKAKKSTPVFFLRELHGQRNLVGYSTWDRKESDTME